MFLFLSGALTACALIAAPLIVLAARHFDRFCRGQDRNDRALSKAHGAVHGNGIYSVSGAE